MTLELVTTPDAVARLETSFNKLTFTYAAKLRQAVEDFNEEPISLSSIDRLRVRVMSIAASLAEPIEAGR